MVMVVVMMVMVPVSVTVRTSTSLRLPRLPWRLHRSVTLEQIDFNFIIFDFLGLLIIIIFFWHLVLLMTVVIIQYLHLDQVENEAHNRDRQHQVSMHLGRLEESFCSFSEQENCHDPD